MSDSFFSTFLNIFNLIKNFISEIEQNILIDCLLLRKYYINITQYQFEIKFKNGITFLARFDEIEYQITTHVFTYSIIPNAVITFNKFNMDIVDFVSFNSELKETNSNMNNEFIYEFVDTYYSSINEYNNDQELENKMYEFLQKINGIRTHHQIKVMNDNFVIYDLHKKVIYCKINGIGKLFLN